MFRSPLGRYWAFGTDGGTRGAVPTSGMDLRPVCIRACRTQFVSASSRLRTISPDLTVEGALVSEYGHSISSILC